MSVELGLCVAELVVSGSLIEPKVMFSFNTMVSPAIVQVRGLRLIRVDITDDIMYCIKRLDIISW